MKQFATAFLLIAGNSIFAQQVLFEKSIPEQALPGIHRVSEVMGEHYLTTRYVHQEEFLKPQDLEIRLTPETIIRSRFQKMYHYPNGAFS